MSELGQQLRVDSVRSSSAANSGHPTSSMSAADLMAVLMEKHLHLDYQNPENPNNDHLIFSKGHASPLYYAMLKAAGAISDEDLLSFRRFGSKFEGHPVPIIPWVDVATGSLGQGLPIAVGVALAGKKLDRLPYRVWCLCGDSEMAEGSMWEAFENAAFNGLDNLTAIIDVNRLGQTRETMVGWDLDRYVKRAEAFGWHAIAIDGHDDAAIDAAYAEARETTGKPTVIVARTKKGKGVKAVEDLPGKHGKPVEDEDAAIEELGGYRELSVDVATPEDGGREPHVFDVSDGELPTWDVGESVATREAYGKVITALGSMHGDVVALDGEVSNSTHAEMFREAHEDRYFEMFIAEQQLVAATVGLQVRGWKAFASTFAAFFSRAYDFVRMAAISRADLRLSGSHAGVSIGEDGPSQMALEDFATFRAIHGSVRPAPVRRQPGRAAAGGDGRPQGHLLPADAARQDAGAHAGRRVGHDRRQPDRPRGRRRRDRRLRHRRRPGGRGGRAARGRGRERPRHRRLLDQADRRGGDPRRRPASAGRSSRSRTTGPRAAWATRCSTRWPTPTTGRRSRSSRCARCRRRASPTSSCTPRRSTPRRSPARPARSRRPAAPPSGAASALTSAVRGCGRPRAMSTTAPMTSRSVASHAVGDELASILRSSNGRLLAPVASRSRRRSVDARAAAERARQSANARACRKLETARFPY